jgi:hypothetical protein
MLSLDLRAYNPNSGKKFKYIDSNNFFGNYNQPKFKSSHL